MLRSKESFPQKKSDFDLYSAPEFAYLSATAPIAQLVEQLICNQ
jgi:hypothetical protein